MLASLLSSPLVWVGFGAALCMVVLLGSGSAARKKKQSRLQRVTEYKSVTAVAGKTSLRRHRAGEDSGLGHILASMQSISKLRARLEVAGMADTSPQKFLGSMVAIALVVIAIITIGLGKSPLVALPLGLMFGLGIPHVMVSRNIRKRQLAFLKLFPDAIELMVRGLRAGLPVAESFITVSKELPPPVGDTFATIAQQTQLGMPMEKALTEAANKLALTELNFFVTTIILQRETGGNLGEILSNLADMLRQRHMMKLKITALSSEARASAYIVGSLPFLVFTILWFVKPEYLQPLFDDARGNKAMLGAAVSMAFGAFIMKRMTQLEI
jgi:tight adherence protein B